MSFLLDVRRGMGIVPAMARLIWSGEGGWERSGIPFGIMFARREDMEIGAEVGSSTDPPHGILFHDDDNKQGEASVVKAVAVWLR